MKLEGLDKEIFKEWEAMTLREGRYGSTPSSNPQQCARDDLECLDGLLDRAYKSGQWRVGWFAANVVCLSRWSCWMGLQEYAKAADEIQRWLDHPDVRSADPLTRAEYVIREHVIVIVLGNFVEPCLSLIQMIDDGPEPPARMASLISYWNPPDC